MENKTNMGHCECCNKDVDKLTKTYVNDQPAGKQNFMSSYWLCNECFSLRFTDQGAFLEMVNK